MYFNVYYTYNIEISSFQLCSNVNHIVLCRCISMSNTYNIEISSFQLCTNVNHVVSCRCISMFILENVKKFSVCQSKYCFNVI